MSKFVFPEKFISIVCQLYGGMFSQVPENGQCSHTVPVTKGVKQVFVLTPMLFSMTFSVMLSGASSENEHSIKISYHNEGKLFNLKRLQSKTKVEGEFVHEFLLPDDCTLNAFSKAMKHRLIFYYLC